MPVEGNTFVDTNDVVHTICFTAYIGPESFPAICGGYYFYSSNPHLNRIKTGPAWGRVVTCLGCMSGGRL